MIILQESEYYGYSTRTRDNVLYTDATLIFAINLESAGTRLTIDLCNKYKKPYFIIDLTKNNSCKNLERFFEVSMRGKKLALNIAGNGLSTFYEANKNIDQKDINLVVQKFLEESNAKKYINLIQSGGQTGADEAGILAAINLDIPAKIIAPAGWRFRDKFKKDISNEDKFKARFNK